MAAPRIPQVAALVLGAVACIVGRADEARAAPADVRAALVAAQADVVDAADALRRGDRAAAGALLDDAVSRLRQTSYPGALVRRTASRIARVRDAVVVLPTDDATPAVLKLRRVAAQTGAALGTFALRGGSTCGLVATRGASMAQRPGSTVVLRVRSSAGVVALGVANDDPTRVAVETAVVGLGGRRFRVTWGPDAGAATLSVQCGTGVASLRAFCLGPEGALGAAPPAAPAYASTTLFARAGAALDVAGPGAGGDPAVVFDVAPALPDGLSLDAATGAISGTPTTSGPATAHRVTVRNMRASAFTDLLVDVDPPLPAGVADMAPGFRIDAVAEVADIPVKLAAAADGRVFFSELLTGRLRVIDAQGSLVAQPVATVTTQLAAEQGLFGIAAPPDIAASGTIYVLASAPAGGGKPVRNRVLRYGLTGNVATSGPFVVVDDLPVGELTNGGHLLLGPDGDLYATTGDTDHPDLAQADGSLAGRVLRFATDGSVPADNPIPGSIEWCRGFRNPFGIAFDPATHRLFATENGPTAHDELDFVEPGKNYLWGAPPDAYFGSQTGLRIHDWTPVIVPTGLAVHDGTQFGASYAGDLFLGCYDLAQLRRITIEGIDFRTESVFVQFDESGLAQKPLDVVLGPDGSLWISTFATIWRVRRD